ncbi:MAG: PIN domain-containing protein [Propionibacteriaceae bacterium]|jgi:predicted nucleic acid-binding protein|nr:PIN domain-containing protein [Propionibacteriaceae bacterium]
MRLVADTSVIIAAIIEEEPRHRECHAVLSDAVHAYITPHAATETYYLLAAAGCQSAAEDFLSDIADGFYELVQLEAGDYAVARDVVRHSGGVWRGRRPKPGALDLADAMNVVAAARVETTIIATLDQDYRAIAPLNGPSYFTLVPDDL